MLIHFYYSSEKLGNNFDLNIPEYNEIVQKVVGQQNSSCLSTIKNGFAVLSELVKTNIGARKIERDYK